jgi:PadR family transcriptional regulator, regulatory protein PadR
MTISPMADLTDLDLPRYLAHRYIMAMTTRAMTEPAFFILTALVDAPRHGYGIVGEVAELSGGRVQLKVGTLYGVLDRLVEQGLVEPDHEEVQQGRLRRYYRLTQPGRYALAAEAERQAANARAARQRLGAPRPAKAGSAS